MSLRDGQGLVAEGVPGLLAGAACGVGLVSESSIDPSAASKSLNSLCKLDEQLGTHSGGTLG